MIDAAITATGLESLFYGGMKTSLPRQVFQQKALTPKQVMEEKLKRQKELEQQDLELALEALGGFFELNLSMVLY